jgi:uncharacterized protein YoaH (UPF0181 family)
MFSLLHKKQTQATELCFDHNKISKLDALPLSTGQIETYFAIRLRVNRLLKDGKK